MRKILALAFLLLISSAASAQQTFNNPGGTRFTTTTRGVPFILGASAVASSHTGSTAETTLATIPVAAGQMGANGILRITAQFGYTGGTSTWTPRIKFNGTAFIDPAAFANTSLSARMQTQIANRNATNSQVGTTATQVNFGATSAAIVTSAHDTTTSLNITITGQLTNGADTVTLHSYLVELIVP